MIWCIKTYIIAYVKKKKRFIIHYVKPTAQLYVHDEIVNRKLKVSYQLTVSTYSSPLVVVTCVYTQFIYV